MFCFMRMADYGLRDLVCCVLRSNITCMQLLVSANKILNSEINKIYIYIFT